MRPCVLLSAGLLQLLVLGCGCPDLEDPAAPPAGLQETASCRDAPQGPRVTIAGRSFCGLREAPVDPVLGDYHDEVRDGFELDVDGFTRAMNAALAASGPRGYAWTLVQANRPAAEQVVAAGSGGVAATRGDAGGFADVAFTPATPSNIGSVTKWLAAIGLVHAYERSTRGLPPDERFSFRQLLSAPFFEFLPARWQRRYATDNGLRTVSVGQLLTHTSRLVSVERDRDVEDILESLEYNAGVAALADNQLGYANINYRLLYLVIGALLDPAALRAVEDDGAEQSPCEFDDLYMRTAATITRAHFEGELFAAVPGGMPGTDCDPEAFGGDWAARIAWAYRDQRDGAGSTYNSLRANRGYCSTTGGYYSSSADLAALAHAYHNGLITAPNRAILEGGGGMGWFILGRAPVPFGDPELDAATMIPGLLRKHGAQPVDGTDDLYQASVYKLPYGHYLALTVNSGYADGSSTTQRTLEVVAAFAAAFTLQ